jgi:hypothetical protein
MSMARLLDLIALAIVALVLLFPQPGIQAYPAARGDETDLLRLAALDDALYRDPSHVGTAIDLARTCLAVEQPGWAVAVLEPFLGHARPEAHQVAAFAYATLLMPQQALAQAEAGLQACERTGCSDPARIRLSYLADMMRKLVQQGVDPRKDPLRAKQAVSESLKRTKVPDGKR